MSSRDAHFMRLALDEAAKGRGTARPNPMVGCVIVRGDEVVGRGFHLRAGLAHAEVEALRDAGDLARGAEVFVNLEPCSHFGRTPPCADALIAAGVARVVAGMIDPNPQVSGRGMRRLAVAGIETAVGPLEAECRALNEGFVSVISRRRPFVTLKLAMTLDGRIASRDGTSRWITSEEARLRVHRWRAEHDAILVGAGTLRADNPQLTARGVGAAVQPTRFVLDTRLSAPLDATIFNDGAAPTVVLCGSDADAERIASLRARGIEVDCLALEEGRLPVQSILDAVVARGCLSLFVEGGATLAGALLDAGVIDRVRFFYAPLLLGGERALAAIGGRGFDAPAVAARLSDISYEQVGPDLLVTGSIAPR